MLLGKKNTTLQTYSTHKLQCSPPPPKKSFFLWCIHFSKVTSEAFPSWPLKQHQKKPTKSLPQEAHEAIAVAWTASLRTDATGEAAGWGGADIFPRLFLSPEEEDEDGVMSEVPFVRQHESLSSSFRYTLFFSFHYRIWCHLFLPSPQEKKKEEINPATVMSNLFWELVWGPTKLGGGRVI